MGKRIPPVEGACYDWFPLRRPLAILHFLYSSGSLRPFLPVPERDRSYDAHRLNSGQPDCLRQVRHEVSFYGLISYKAKGDLWIQR